MLGVYNHNIFNGSVDYFNKSFLYSGCKDIIASEGLEPYKYDLNVKYINSNESNSTELEFKFEKIYNDIWKNNYKIDKEKNIFYIWVDENDYHENDNMFVDEDYKNKKTVFVTKTKKVTKKSDIIGEFCIDLSDNEKIKDNFYKCVVDEIKKLDEEFFKYTFDENSNNEVNTDSQFKILWSRYYSEYDAEVYGYRIFNYCGTIDCSISISDIKYVNNNFTEVCDNEWEYFDKEFAQGYNIDISKIYVKEGSIRNILNNLDDKNSIVEISVHDGDFIKTFFNIKYKDFEGYDKDGKILSEISFNVKNGCVTISPTKEYINQNNTYIQREGFDGKTIENLLIDIHIIDKLDKSITSIGLKEYFSVFNQLSMFSISNYINMDNDNYVKYYSTVEDNKYKIRVIEPDIIEVEDIYEAIPMKVSQNNKSVIGTINIELKNDVDKIGMKVINRYSGFYNPIFNDILYYDDYTYTKSIGVLDDIKYELPYSNTHIDYNYNDGYGKFGVIKNMYYHKTNVSKSNKILESIKPIYPAINEYALGYRDYNVFSSNWDNGYFMSQDDLNNSSVCSGIGSMKDSLCMFGSKYLNVPDFIFIDTFENGKIFDDRMVFGIGEDIDSEILYKEINNRTVRYHLFIKKRLKRYLKEKLIEVFSKYINKDYSFGNKGTIEDDVEEYVEKNLLKLYKVDKIYMYVKNDISRINNKKIDNDYLKYVNKNNEFKLKSGFPGSRVGGEVILKNNKFIMEKMNTNEFDRIITYNLKSGFKESFGFGVSFIRK